MVCDNCLMKFCICHRSASIERFTSMTVSLRTVPPMTLTRRLEITKWIQQKLDTESIGKDLQFIENTYHAGWATEQIMKQFDLNESTASWIIQEIGWW